MVDERMSVATRAVHAGRADLTDLGVHVPPIDLSTTYPLPDVEAGGAAYDHLAGGEAPDAGQTPVYQRLWSPGAARFEDALADLEGGEAGIAFASGMAALSAVLLACAAAGTPHVVAVRPLYGGSDHLLDSGLLGTSVTWTDVDGVTAALQPDTGLVVVETPANPTLDLVDLRAVVAAAGEVPVMVDNTFATPVLQRPLELGATLVMHSVTKFLAGHGDVLAGAVVTSREWATRLRPVRAITGAVLHPLSAYLAHRGLQTLAVRVRAQQDGAQVVARWLAEREDVRSVFYPGLDGADPAGLIGTQMSGPGALLALDLGSRDRAAAVAGRCALIGHAVSLGGVDSLVQHPAALTHRIVQDGARPGDGILRLSVGLEAPEDLIADLEQALTSD